MFRSTKAKAKGCAAGEGEGGGGGVGGWGEEGGDEWRGRGGVSGEGGECITPGALQVWSPIAALSEPEDDDLGWTRASDDLKRTSSQDAGIGSCGVGGVSEVEVVVEASQKLYSRDSPQKRREAGEAGWCAEKVSQVSCGDSSTGKTLQKRRESWGGVHGDGSPVKKGLATCAMPREDDGGSRTARSLFGGGGPGGGANCGSGTGLLGGDGSEGWGEGALAADRGARAEWEDWGREGEEWEELETGGERERSESEGCKDVVPVVSLLDDDDDDDDCEGGAGGRGTRGKGRVSTACNVSIRDHDDDGRLIEGGHGGGQMFQNVVVDLLTPPRRQREAHGVASGGGVDDDGAMVAPLVVGIPLGAAGGGSGGGQDVIVID